jgi:protein-tyrosine phosphatase
VALTELHFHLLPGVDDGPADFDEALALARAATLDGTRTIVATPHLRGDFLTDPGAIPGLAAELRAWLREENLDLRVLASAELGHDMVGRLAQRELEGLSLGPPGARWLLVECPFAGPAEPFEDALEELRARGFGIVLAHPERSAAEVWPAIERAVAAGAALQVNATSALGRHGRAARELAFELILDRRAAAIASDAHGWLRMPALSLWLATAPRRGVPPSLARRLVEAGPAALLGRGLAPAAVALAA